MKPKRWKVGDDYYAIGKKFDGFSSFYKLLRSNKPIRQNGSKETIMVYNEEFDDFFWATAYYGCSIVLCESIVDSGNLFECRISNLNAVIKLKPKK